MQVDDPRIRTAKAAIWRAKIHTSVDRLARWSLISFCVSLAVIGLFIWASGGKPDRSYMIFGMSAAVSTVLSGLTYVADIALREVLLLCQSQWRFSVRSLLVLTTWVAVALGTMMFLVRK